MPVGRLSDKTDRRYVLVGASLACAVVGVLIFLVAPRSGAFVIAMTSAYGAFAYTLYSLAVAHANDHAKPEDFVKVSGGLFKDMAIHDFDMARWLLGEEAVEVYAAGSCLVDPEIGKLGDVDTARTVLKTASGRICVISNSRRSGFGYDQRIEAYASAGMVRADNVTESTVQVWGEDGAAADRFQNFFLDRYAEAYRAEMDHFAAILWGEKPSVGYADGVAALALAEAAGESARTGKPVTLQA
jgi:myo-inositol 2-dehydrogenase/D-chiro-inositol 1-dehydrogenase